MVHICKNCKKFLAKTKKNKLKIAMGKSISYELNDLVIICHCGEKNIIKIKEV